MKFSLTEIAKLLGGTIEGDSSRMITTLSKIQEASEGSLSFLSNPKYENHIYSTRASAVLVNHDFEARKEISTTLVRVQDPYAAFSLLLEEYHKIVSFQKSGVEEPAFIGKDSKTGKNVYRGAFSYIGENVTIGDDVKIYPHSYIGDSVKIGNRTIIYSGTRIYSDTEIGSNCVIHSGAVIGSDGFGFAPQDDGTYKAIPQMGKVILRDRVSVGANTTIDCATFKGDATIIHDGSKLDNLIQIAHNVEIGKNTVIAAQTGISGSTKIGDQVVIAGQVGIVGHLEIANKTTIAAQSGIAKSITKEEEVLLGSPAFDHKQYLKVYAVFKKLPDLDARIRELEEKMLNLRTV